MGGDASVFLGSCFGCSVVSFLGLGCGRDGRDRRGGRDSRDGRAIRAAGTAGTAGQSGGQQLRRKYI